MKYRKYRKYRKFDDDDDFEYYSRYDKLYDDDYDDFGYHDCHKGNVEVFRFRYKGKIFIVFAGGEARGFKPSLNDVNILFTNFFLKNNSTFNFFPYDYHFILFNVLDGDAPNLTLKDYFKLFDKFCELFPEKESIKLGIACQGGHGRTGTVLAIIANLFLNVKNPIEFVRKRYCKKAIETETQIEYIRKLTNTHETAKPSKKPVKFKFNKFKKDWWWW